MQIFRPVRALALFAMLAVVGCGACATSNATLRGHSLAAQTLDDFATGAKATALDMRQAVLDKAAVDAHKAGLMGDALTAEVKKAAVTFDAGPVIGAVNAFIATKDIYVRAVLVAASKDTPTWADVKPMLRGAIAAYTAMRDAFGKPDKMPPIPTAISDLLAYVARTTEVVS